MPEETTTAYESFETAWFNDPVEALEALELAG
jgi:hypothetical protein